MRAALLLALAGAALLPAPAAAAAHHEVPDRPPRSCRRAPPVTPARRVAGRMERTANGAGIGARPARCAARQGHVRHVRSLWIASAVAVTADAERHRRATRAPGCALDRSRLRAPDPARGCRHAEPGVGATRAPELWATESTAAGSPWRRSTPASISRTPRSRAAIAEAATAGSTPIGEHTEPGRPPRPRDAGHGRHGRRRRHRHGARRALHRGAGLQRRGREHRQRRPPRVPVAARSRRQPCDRRRARTSSMRRGAHSSPPATGSSSPTSRPCARRTSCRCSPPGNDGPGAPSDTSPGNLPEAFAVGAEADATTIAAFSSIGPSRCDGGQFPSLVAAGTGIRSTDRFGFDATGLAGTSFAAPHVAGALALLLQVAPQLAADDQAGLLTQSAHDLGTPGPDATFGAGSLDVAAAARLLSPTLDFSPPRLSGAAFADSRLRMHAVDDSSAIAAGELWADADPGVGAGQPMVAADGSLDSPGEDLVAAVAGLAPGDHTIGFRARDAAGNWSSASLLAVSVPAPPASAPPPRRRAGRTRPPAVVAPPLAGTTSQHDRGERRVRARTRRLAGAPAPSRRFAELGDLGPAGTARAQHRAVRRHSCERRLPQPGARVELAFESAAEHASRVPAPGRRLPRSRAQTAAGWPPSSCRASRQRPGPPAHQREQRLGERPCTRRGNRSRAATRHVLLALDPAHAVLLIDGRAARVAYGAASTAAPAATIALGAWRPAPCELDRLPRHRQRHGALGTRRDLTDIPPITEPSMPRRLPSPALVVASLALAVALGGTTYAATALPKNSVGAKQLKSGSVSAVKLAKDSVTSRQIKDHTIVAADLAKNAYPALPGKVASAGHADTAGRADSAGHADTAGSVSGATFTTIDYRAAAGSPAAAIVSANGLVISASCDAAGTLLLSIASCDRRCAVRAARDRRHRQRPRRQLQRLDGRGLRPRRAPGPARPDAREPAPDLPESGRKARARRDRDRRRGVQRRDELLRGRVRHLVSERISVPLVAPPVCGRRAPRHRQATATPSRPERTPPPPTGRTRSRPRQ